MRISDWSSDVCSSDLVAAYRTDRTGTVTAVSNNAGAFSVPEPGTNALPDGLDAEDMARLVMDCRFDAPFEVSTGNGFCLYIKRALLDDVGLFDADNLPVGFGTSEMRRVGKECVSSCRTWVSTVYLTKKNISSPSSQRYL